MKYKIELETPTNAIVDTEYLRESIIHKAHDELIHRIKNDNLITKKISKTSRYVPDDTIKFEGEIHIYRSEIFKEISKTVDRLSTHTQHMQDSDLFHTVERLKHFLNK